MKGFSDQMMFDRRKFLAFGTSAVLVSVCPVPSFALPEDVLRAQRELFGDRPVQVGKVTLKMPSISENGNSVPLSVRVDSPMTRENYVRQIAVFSPRNPLPDVARFHLSPAMGRAEVSTRIRLGGTQTIQAIAEMSDGSLWSGSAETVVTLAACVIL